MGKSFLNSDTPFIMEMVQSHTAENAIFKIRNAIADGATAIGFQMGYLEKQYRTEETIRSIFAEAGDKPIYFTNYRSHFNVGMSDEELMDGLRFGLNCGANLIDVMGDAFNPSYEELTTDEKAIKKQMEFIDEIHKRGGDVLMSSHIREFRDSEHVLKMALEHQRRGADIAKIVTGAKTQEEEIKNLETCRLLKQELKIPFLFLSTGKYSYLHRMVGPALGVSMWLCFREYDEYSYPGPPLLADVIKIKQGLKL